MPFGPTYMPEPRFDALGPDFFDVVAPADFPGAVLRRWDGRAAKRVGLGALTAEEKRRHFARFEPLPNNLSAPLAMRYHGHQFRAYNPDIGDGRGFLFAQLRDDRGRLLDIGTKGTGLTPWSRTADGRMTLQGGVRETLISAFLEAAGVPGCAILALFETGEELQRYDEPSPARGAVMARLQHGHVRIGTFQRHAFENAPDRIRALIDHCAEVYFRELLETDAERRPAAFLKRVVAENARLAATWMAAGFVHGVLNSDNMTVTGESFDYGPSRFLPVFEPLFTAAYFDQGGIYAYARQAESTLWNLQRLAECLTLVAPADPLVEALHGFEPEYQSALGAAFAARFGVEPRGDESDLDLVRAFFDFARASRAPFEGVLFDWFGGEGAAARAMSGPRAGYYRGGPFDAFAALMGQRRPVSEDARGHCYFEREAPIALTIDVMRGVWGDIDARDDWSSFDAALAAIAEMGEAMSAARPVQPA